MIESRQQSKIFLATNVTKLLDHNNVIRTAVSLGGDCDTLTCIAGGMGEAFYGVPEGMIAECRKRLPEDMLAVLDAFEERVCRGDESFHDSFLDGNEIIEQAIADFHAEGRRAACPAGIAGGYG